jgi:hypothetical protein
VLTCGTATTVSLYAYSCMDTLQANTQTDCVLWHTYGLGMWLHKDQPCSGTLTVIYMCRQLHSTCMWHIHRLDQWLVLCQGIHTMHAVVCRSDV